MAEAKIKKDRVVEVLKGNVDKDEKDQTSAEDLVKEFGISSINSLRMAVLRVSVEENIIVKMPGLFPNKEEGELTISDKGVHVSINRLGMVKGDKVKTKITDDGCLIYKVKDAEEKKAA